MIVNKRRNKQNTHINSYTYTTHSGSSQSSNHSGWLYLSPLSHSRHPSADVSRSSYTPYQAPTQGLQIHSHEILPTQIIQPGPSSKVQLQSHVHAPLPETSPQPDATYNNSLQSQSRQYQNIFESYENA